MWDNDNADLNLFLVSTDTYLYNNDFGSRIGNIANNESGNISIEPDFENPGIFDYTPSETSLLINNGIDPNTDIEAFQSSKINILGDIDFIGSVRTQALKVDIGAFESPYDRIFKNGFDSP